MPAVAVQPVYCLDPGDRDRLHLLTAIAANCRLDEVPHAALPDGGDRHVDVHWLHPAEVAARYAAFPDALAEVGRLAARS